MEKEVYYKVLDKNNKAQNGGDFDYTPYLDGTPLPRIEDIRLCYTGYHLTKYWNMWIQSEEDKIYEVEPIDVLRENIVGVEEKIVCKSFRIIREFIPRYQANSNTGNWNTGYRNTGNSNTGNRNTGDSNTGNRNAGNRNTGDNNTGNRNTGDNNTGDNNAGDNNTGDNNAGDNNTGNRNTGDNNTGNWNTGNWNTGDNNTGNWNTGNWNTGNRNTGSLNTIKPKITQLFNKNIKMADYEKIVFPNYFYFELKKNYKQSWIESFNKAPREEIKNTIKLPNFSYKIFEEITGISKKMITERLK